MRVARAFPVTFADPRSPTGFSEAPAWFEGDAGEPDPNGCASVLYDEGSTASYTRAELRSMARDARRLRDPKSETRMRVTRSDRGAFCVFDYDTRSGKAWLIGEFDTRKDAETFWSQRYDDYRDIFVRTDGDRALYWTCHRRGAIGPFKAVRDAVRARDDARFRTHRHYLGTRRDKHDRDGAQYAAESDHSLEDSALSVALRME